VSVVDATEPGVCNLKTQFGSTIRIQVAHTSLMKQFYVEEKPLSTTHDGQLSEVEVS